MKNKNVNSTRKVKSVAFDVSTKQPIDKKTAIRFVKKFKDTFNSDGKNTVYVSFTFVEIANFMRLNPVSGSLRFYFAINDSGDQTIVVTAANDGFVGERIELPEINGRYGVDFGALCPPECSCSSDIDSIAHIVYKGSKFFCT